MVKFIALASLPASLVLADCGYQYLPEGCNLESTSRSDPDCTLVQWSKADNGDSTRFTVRSNYKRMTNCRWSGFTITRSLDQNPADAYACIKQLWMPDPDVRTMWMSGMTDYALTQHDDRLGEVETSFEQDEERSLVECSFTRANDASDMVCPDTAKEFMYSQYNLSRGNSYRLRLGTGNLYGGQIKYDYMMDDRLVEEEIDFGDDHDENHGHGHDEESAPVLSDEKPRMCRKMLDSWGYCKTLRLCHWSPNKAWVVNKVGKCAATCDRLRDVSNWPEAGCGKGLKYKSARKEICSRKGCIDSIEDDQ